MNDFLRPRNSLPYSLLALLLISVLHSIKPVLGQSADDSWMPPLNLFETNGRASEAEVVADPSGVVHVFWAYGDPENLESGAFQSIYHARLEDGAWSAPVDVLVSPGGRVARFPSVAVDSQGYLHAVWSGGNELYYSRAYAAEAGSAAGWSSPLALASGAGAAEPSVAVDADGRVFVVWTEAGNGLLFAMSEDGGNTWAGSQTIYYADQSNELARWGRIAVDEAGRLHVVFTYTERLESAAAQGREDPNTLYYLRSDNLGQTWSEPLPITPELDFGEVNVVTSGADTVHLVWNGRAGRHGRYHRWSEDGGQTWSSIVEVLAPAPRSPIGTGGLTGFPALATDATGALHMVSATGGDHYFRWQDGTWSPPVYISPGLDGSGVTGTNNSLEQPSIAISEGNRLHVVFHDGFERIWYTTSTTDAPFQPPVALDAGRAAVEAPAALPQETPAVDEQQTPAPVQFDRTVPPDGSSDNLPLLASTAAALLLVSLVVLIFNRRRSQ